MKKIYILVAIVLSSCVTLYAQEKPALESLPLTNRLPVLNDKAFFSFPAKAVNIARSNDIMSANPNENDETRIVVNSGNMRLVFFAKELFSLANREMFLSALGQKNEEYKFTTKILTDKDSLLSIISTPSKLNEGEKAILINSLLVKTPDHTIFRIDAFINPEALKQKVAYQKLSEKVFATLSRGNRRINLQPRKEVFPIIGSSKTFEVALPAGYTVTRDAKYDFQVLKFHKYLSMLDTVWTALTVYTGNHPSYFFSDYGLSAEKAVKVKGSFLGKEVDWLLFKDTGKGFSLKEQQVPAGFIEKDLVVHAAMLSNSPSLMTELSRIVALIKVSGS